MTPLWPLCPSGCRGCCGDGHCCGGWGSGRLLRPTDRRSGPGRDAGHLAGALRIAAGPGAGGPPRGVGLPDPLVALFDVLSALPIIGQVGSWNCCGTARFPRSVRPGGCPTRIISRGSMTFRTAAFPICRVVGVCIGVGRGHAAIATILFLFHRCDVRVMIGANDEPVLFFWS